MKREFLKKIIVSGMITLIATNTYIISASAKWSKDSNGGWNWSEDGVKAVGWAGINNNWYYFNKDGIMQNGWLNDNGIWYNLSSSGEMSIGWKMIDGKWYYFNQDGQMNIGWITDNGRKYFTNQNGEMQIGTIKIEGKTYTFSDSGAMLDNDSINETSNDSTIVGNSGKGNGNSNVAYVVTNSDSLNVRSDATLASDIIGTINKGTEVKIIDDERNGFYPIILSGKKGWVSSEWVSFKETENVATQSIVDQPIINTNNGIGINPPPISNQSVNQTVGLIKLEGIRDTKPTLDNKFYYSDENLFYKVKLSPPFSSGGKVITGNCTWYAWGRAWEMTGKKPDDAGFIGNGYEWWDANKKSGKYQYGSEPRVGAIAVWKSSLPGSDGSGHVAIVEKIESGKTYISESTWHGIPFSYREIYDTNYLYGYIYLDKPNS